MKQFGPTVTEACAFVIINKENRWLPNDIKVCQAKELAERIKREATAQVMGWFLVLSSLLPRENRAQQSLSASFA
jgi:hypothetical protein